MRLNIFISVAYVWGTVMVLYRIMKVFESHC
jgi:hypothetical protein